jgi:hypothetical protein
MTARALASSGVLAALNCLQKPGDQLQSCQHLENLGRRGSPVSGPGLALVSRGWRTAGGGHGQKDGLMIVRDLVHRIPPGSVFSTLASWRCRAAVLTHHVVSRE